MANLGKSIVALLILCASTACGGEDIVAPLDVPSAPRSLTVSTVTQTTVEVTWAATTNTTVTRYEYQINDAFWSTIPGSDNTTTSHTFVSLIANTEYTLSIRAVNAAGEGASDCVAATTLPPDFVGQVLIPADMRPRSHAIPADSVSVTIVSGPRAGEEVETDQNGQYVFPEVEEDRLHIRLEKEKHETKEAIVHRTKATTLTDTLPLEYEGPQDTPGTVLIGLAWPEYSKQVMDTLSVIADLLLISSEDQEVYGWGVAAVKDPEEPNPSKTGLTHEICHAHQHGVVRPRGGGTGSGTGWGSDWISSPEAKAYLEAREADREEIGYNRLATFLDDPWNDSNLSIIEENANVCAYWWGAGYRRYDIEYWRAWLKEHLPNRAEWAKEWLYRP